MGRGLCTSFQFSLLRTGTWVKRKFRLTRSTDFKRVRRFGKSYAHPLVVLVVEANPDESVKIGVTASRSVGGAVERNRAKRRLRAILHEVLPQLSKGWNLVFLARKGINDAEFDQLRSAVLQLLKRAGLVVKEGNVSEPS